MYASRNPYALKYIPFVYARQTVANERHPMRNEDSILLEETTGLVAVFDGVGGSAAGEVASQMAAQATAQSWRRIVRQHVGNRPTQSFLEYSEHLHLPDLLQELILDADELVRTEGAQRAGTDDLATTVALAVICRKPDRQGYVMFYAHVGDSRVYLSHEQQPLCRLTSDDGLLAKLVENKIVDEPEALRIDQAMHPNQLSDIELRYFKLRGGITQALGGPLPPLVHVQQVDLVPGDRVLLCTDGIHDNLIDSEIDEVLHSSPRSFSARVLVERALLRSREPFGTTIRSKPDDMSSIVLTCRF